MNYDLDILYLETSIILDQCENDTNAMIFNSVFNEAGDENKESLFKRIIDRIKKMVADAKDKIVAFFNSKSSKEAIDGAEEAMKKNPKLKNAKVKVPDFDKLNKLLKKTEADIKNNPERIDEFAKREEKLAKILLGDDIAISGGYLLSKIKTMLDVNRITNVDWMLDIGRQKGTSEEEQNRAVEQAKKLEKLTRTRIFITNKQSEKCFKAINQLSDYYIINDSEMNKTRDDELDMLVKWRGVSHMKNKYNPDTEKEKLNIISNAENFYKSKYDIAGKKHLQAIYNVHDKWKDLTTREDKRNNKKKVTTESVNDLMNRFLDKFIKKKNKSTTQVSSQVPQLKKYTEHYGNYDISIYLHECQVTDDMVNRAHDAVKRFNFNKFEKDLNKFVKENYDYYVEDQLDGDEVKVSFQDVINSRKRVLFSFRAYDGELDDNYYEIWVLYKSWADEKDSTLCPEAEVSVKKDGSYTFNDFHLG